MKVALNRWWWMAVVFAMLTGCAGMQLDTMNKRLAAFEISYKQALKAVELSESRLTPAEKASVANAIEDIERVRGSMYAALAASDIGTAESDLAKVLGLLAVVRQIAVETGG